MKIPFIFLAFFVSFQPNAFFAQKEKLPKRIKSEFPEAAVPLLGSAHHVPSSLLQQGVGFLKRMYKPKDTKDKRADVKEDKSVQGEGVSLGVVTKVLPSILKYIEFFEARFAKIDLKKPEQRNENFLVLNNLLSQIINGCEKWANDIKKALEKGRGVILKPVVGSGRGLFHKLLLPLYQKVALELISLDSVENRSTVEKCYSKAYKDILLDAAHVSCGIDLYVGGGLITSDFLKKLQRLSKADIELFQAFNALEEAHQQKIASVS